MEVVGIKREGCFQDGFDFSPEDAVVRSGHTDIALEGSAFGKDLFIGGGDMGMRPEDRADFAIEKVSHRLFIAGGFGVQIDQSDSNVRG